MLEAIQDFCEDALATANVQPAELGAPLQDFLFAVVEAVWEAIENDSTGPLGEVAATYPIMYG